MMPRRDETSQRRRQNTSETCHPCSPWILLFLILIAGSSDGLSVFIPTRFVKRGQLYYTRRRSQFETRLFDALPPDIGPDFMPAETSSDLPSGESMSAANDADPSLLAGGDDILGDSAPFESPLQDETTTSKSTSAQSPSVSRRDWLKTGLYVTGICALAADIGFNHDTKRGIPSSNSLNPMLNTQPLPPLISTKTTTGSLQPINITKVVQETRINITLSKEETHSCVCMDHVTFQKKQYVNLPNWVPPWLAPKPKTIKDITDTELLIAAVAAGTVVEMTRTTLLYPIVTLKTRVQTDINSRTRQQERELLELSMMSLSQDEMESREAEMATAGNQDEQPEPNDEDLEDDETEAAELMMTNNMDATSDNKIPLFRNQVGLPFQRRIQVMGENIQKHFGEGNLYAGLIPSLLVAAPATGVYYGIRDVTKRTLTLSENNFAMLQLSDLTMAVLATLVASIAATAIRSPVDALSTRLQVAAANDDQDNATEEDQEEREERISEEVGDWFTESLERLPILVATDIPYLLCRVVVNGALIHGTLDFGRYEILAISSALLSGVVTTPFDVARTRILLDSDDDPTNGADGGSGDSLGQTFRDIINESDDGFANLFRGWFERALYLGIGRAWLEPLQIVGYIAIRDAILLEWFD